MFRAPRNIGAKPPLCRCFCGHSSPMLICVQNRMELSGRSAHQHRLDAAWAMSAYAGMVTDLDTVFAALADPTRRAILSLLLEDDMAVTDVAEPFEISLAAISKHLAILTRAGLISQEKRGRVKWCKLEPDALREASVWMQGFGQFEPVNLEAFERFLASEIGGEDTA